MKLKTGKKVSLFDRDVQKCIDLGQLEAKSYNIFERDSKRYGFIRCMNLLNRSYFSDTQIKVGILNLFESLDDKGYLQIGRTDDQGVNRASVYRKEQRRLTLVLQFNGGAEIGNIVEMMEIYSRRH
jgi:chemotaxis methyl-accepting protein methylase